MKLNEAFTKIGETLFIRQQLAVFITLIGHRSEFVHSKDLLV